jgi:hypothetical protein
VPLDLLHYATFLAAPIALSRAAPPPDEIALFSWFQRLLMTLSSLCSLLRDGASTVEAQAEWEGHVRAVAERFHSMESEVIQYMATALCRLDAAQGSHASQNLSDPVALNSTVAEVWRVWTELRRTATIDVPRLRAKAAATLVPNYHRLCLDVEERAKGIEQRITPQQSSGTDDINQLLVERGNVKSIAKEKADLLRSVPKGVCPSPMPTVDFLVDKCLPPN